MYMPKEKRGSVEKDGECINFLTEKCVLCET